MLPAALIHAGARPAMRSSCVDSRHAAPQATAPCRPPLTASGAAAANNSPRQHLKQAEASSYHLYSLMDL
ncbi:hypothetical protein V6N13_064142 [Hibiscus sabdariffa]